LHLIFFYNSSTTPNSYTFSLHDALPIFAENPTPHTNPDSRIANHGAYNFIMIRVLLYGLGPIGAMVARQLAARDGFRVVGGVDVDPAKVGRDVGEISGVAHPLRVKVNPDAARTIKQTKPDIVVLCTSSSLKSVMPQIEEVLKAKVAM